MGEPSIPITQWTLSTKEANIKRKTAFMKYPLLKLAGYE